MEEIIEYLLNLKEWDKYIDKSIHYDGYAIMFPDNINQAPDDIILEVLAKLKDVPGSNIMLKLSNLYTSLDDMASKLKKHVIKTGNLDDSIKLDKANILSFTVKIMIMIRKTIKSNLDRIKENKEKEEEGTM